MFIDYKIIFFSNFFEFSKCLRFAGEFNGKALFRCI